MTGIRKLLAHWEVGRTIARPVFVNLLTAFLLFMGVVIFKPTIFRVLGIQLAPDFPLICVVEAYRGPGGDDVVVDLYIVNLESRPLEYHDLQLQLDAASSGAPLAPDFRIVPTKWGEIKDVSIDKAFNGDKGEFAEPSKEGTHHVLRVKKIDDRAILRVRMNALSSRPAFRESKSTIPVEIRYPGRPCTD